MLDKFMHGFKGLLKPSARCGDDWDFSDRRKLVRLKCCFEVLIDGLDSPFRAQILDMGVLGMGLRCGRPLMSGDKIKVALLAPLEGVPSEPVDCQVVWAKPPDGSQVTYAGAAYCSPPLEMLQSWVNTVLYELGFTKNSIYSKRRYVRAECVLPGRLYEESRPGPQVVTCCNLGVGGALLEHNVAVPVGEHIALSIGPHRELPVLQAKGRVVRVNRDHQGFLLGVDFDELSSPKVRLLGLYLRALLRLDSAI